MASKRASPTRAQKGSEAAGGSSNKRKRSSSAQGSPRSPVMKTPAQASEGPVADNVISSAVVAMEEIAEEEVDYVMEQEQSFNSATLDLDETDEAMEEDEGHSSEEISQNEEDGDSASAGPSRATRLNYHVHSVTRDSIAFHKKVLLLDVFSKGEHYETFFEVYRRRTGSRLVTTDKPLIESAWRESIVQGTKILIEYFGCEEYTGEGRPSDNEPFSAEQALQHQRYQESEDRKDAAETEACAFDSNIYVESSVGKLWGRQGFVLAQRSRLCSEDLALAKGTTATMLAGFGAPCLASLLQGKSPFKLWICKSSPGVEDIPAGSFVAQCAGEYLSPGDAGYDSALQTANSGAIQEAYQIIGSKGNGCVVPRHAAYGEAQRQRCLSLPKGVSDDNLDSSWRRIPDAVLDSSRIGSAARFIGISAAAPNLAPIEIDLPAGPTGVFLFALRDIKRGDLLTRLS